MKLPPRTPWILTALAEARLKLKHMTAVIESCTEALKVEAGHARPCIVRGMARHWKGDAAGRWKIHRGARGRSPPIPKSCSTGR